MGSMSNRRNPRTTFIEYKIVKKSGISGDEMNGFVTKWLGGGWTKMVEIEVKGQMITHDFLAPDRMSSSYPKTLVPIWEIWWRDAMGPLLSFLDANKNFWKCLKLNCQFRAKKKAVVRQNGSYWHGSILPSPNFCCCCILDGYEKQNI